MARENHARRLARMSDEERAAYKAKRTAATKASREKNPELHIQRVRDSRERRIEREGQDVVRAACAARQRELRAGDPGRYRKTEREWRINNRARALVNKARDRAKRRGLDIDITAEDILLPKLCPVLGFELAYDLTRSAFNSPTIDRIDNAKGYVKGNVIVVSKRANTIKNDASVEEIGMVLKFYKDIFSGNGPIISRSSLPD